MPPSRRPRRAPRLRAPIPALCCLSLLAASRPPSAQQLVLPPGFESVELPGVFSVPVGFVFAPDGALVVAEKAGTVRYQASDEVPPQQAPVIDLSVEVNSTGDRGLLSLALHPGWVPDGGPASWMYVAYAVAPVPGLDPQPGEDDYYSFGRLTRYRIGTVGGQVLADLASREVLLGHQQPDGTAPDAFPCIDASHQSGTILFGTDGSLLFAVGEGARASGVDAGGLHAPAFETFVHPVTGLLGPFPIEQDSGAFRAQDLRSLGGKVLRLDPSTGEGYASNPFFDGDTTSNRSRVWALGLRNPFRLALDPVGGSSDPADGLPGRLWIGDVGWSWWEELQRCEGGENYGWPCRDGNGVNALYDTYAAPTPNPLQYPDCGDTPDGVPVGPALAWHHTDATQLEPPVHEQGGAPGPGFIGECVIAGPLYSGGAYPTEYVGRLFVGDFVEGWIRTLELGPGGDVVAVHDFAEQIELLTDLQVHPVNGDLYYLGNANGTETYFHRVRFASDLTPVPDVVATPTAGPAPLVVSFDASGSVDPDGQPLGFVWDFGDGSLPATGVAPVHTYTEDGVYVAQVTVYDPSGLAATGQVAISVGTVSPQAILVSPSPNAPYKPGDELDLIGIGVDPQGGQLTYTWTVDLVHDTHVHPAHQVLFGDTATFLTETHGSPGDLSYYRIELEVSDGQSFTGTDHVYIYPKDQLSDPTGRGLPTAKIESLNPPNPMGAGNRDLEVLRDGDQPPVGTVDVDRQYDTFHLGQQQLDDWLGYTWPTVFPIESRFVGLIFQEGHHYTSGGWWDTIEVEVRQGGTWLPAQQVRVSPEYPFDLAAQPSFDGTNYETYVVTFDPLYGDGVRLRGNPGGVSNFVSAGELRAVLARPDPAFDPYEDHTPVGTFLARVLELDPPAPQGTGNLDPEILRNETWPPEGSDSSFGQYDTEHGGDQGGLDWMGWEFATPRTFVRVHFQEGLHQNQGGWLETLDVEVRKNDQSPWVPVTGLSTTPSYTPSSSTATSYREFVLTFDPVAGDAIRVVGAPGGSKGFMSAAELRVEGPAWNDPVCGTSVYGTEAGGVNLMTLGSETAPIPGGEVLFVASGGLPFAPGALALSFGPATIPFYGGTVFLDPLQIAFVLPVSLDSAGFLTYEATLPGGVSTDHAEWSFQLLTLDLQAPSSLRLSNGLTMVPCFWNQP